MKTLKLNEDFELDFLILGINSHTKLYKLCWEINKELHTNFVKNKNHTINNNQEFERFHTQIKIRKLDIIFYQTFQTQDT